MNEQPNVNHDGSQEEPEERDPFAPPAEPCECYCLHCNRVFMSTGIWLQRVKGARGDFGGFWMCPTPNCGGAGFTFDIFPTDPNHPANAGWVDDDEEDAEAAFGLAQESDLHDEWDPNETKYRQLDEDLAEDDDDLEGDEWKFGLAPGERPEDTASAAADLEREEEQQRYDMPDERPREVDLTDREEHQIGGGFSEDDIPF